MGKVWVALVVSVITCFAAEAPAQTACPYGAIPGSALCLPDEVEAAPEAQRQPRWKLTWGAMAEDPATGYVGTTTGQPSKRAARRAALANCANMGGRNCKSVLEYENQCAVVAEAIDTSNGSGAIYQAGPTVEAATVAALPLCKTHNAGRDCQVNYSNCTAPVLVR
ncbi:DUF4189 domain-containing protein [Xanthomonas sp. XNM01]|uniref:DUF4189 domain-containing protein n=1 Tax=Xanthomonas sp. XNM01 TaxID=2769289 RepID=UPI00177B461F|nr:DUF4189 domain-containing protein [Xanthomonas sp. XNM01]MBD9367753.1 DUF4189 domain-containing protein [Xanthomonas sp. XNM01]